VEKLRAFWHEIRDSLWFVPALITFGLGGLAVLLVTRGDNLLGDMDASDVWWLFGGGAEGATSVLGSISGSIITVTGVVFSVTIIALQLASSQFTPRVLRQFMADRSNQVVLGVLIGTFTYTLLVQRTVRAGEGDEEFVPAVAVTVAVALALASIALLIYYINHSARSIQASRIIDAAATDTRRAIHRTFPERLDEPAPDTPLLPAVTEAEPHAVRAQGTGYLQAVDRTALRRTAAEAGLVIRLETEIGAHVLRGQVIMSVWPGRDPGEETRDRLCSTLVLGMERTPHQDVKHGVTELMDIALKAMSPSINDPTTAVNSVHRMSEVLLELAWRRGGDDVTCDDEGRPLVVFRRPSLEDTVGLAFNQIRHYAAGNPTFAIMLLETLAELAALAPAGAQAPFLHHIDEVARTARMEIEQEGDRARVERAISAARARAAEGPAAGRQGH
jgi:uncharacterized membrane protein